jgi:hypothetical protein
MTTHIILDNTLEISAALNTLRWKDTALPSTGWPLFPLPDQVHQRFGNDEIDFSAVPALITDDLTFPLEPPSDPSVIEAAPEDQDTILRKKTLRELPPGNVLFLSLHNYCKLLCDRFFVTVQVPISDRLWRPSKKRGGKRGHLALRPGNCEPPAPLLNSYDFCGDPGPTSIRAGLSTSGQQARRVAYWHSQTGTAG